ncbi:hypothetical protein [Phocaeicola sp.]|uniref:hypothetical protein n=1 Tax=Phocaeicola sp. TaxID=2773926 RepID=UPI003AB8D096
MDVSSWFKGFEKGLEKLSGEERERLFFECGKNCVKNGVLSVYEELYEKAEGDMDVFFLKANDLSGVESEVVEKGRVYGLTFLECTCGLYKEGYVTSPLLCECSRQSVIYALHHLWKSHQFRVTLCQSILQGARCCKLKIEVL